MKKISAVSLMILLGAISRPAFADWVIQPGGWMSGSNQRVSVVGVGGPESGATMGAIYTVGEHPAFGTCPATAAVDIDLTEPMGRYFYATALVAHGLRSNVYLMINCMGSEAHLLDIEISATP